MDLKGRNFLTLKDFTPEEITYLLDLSAELKEKKKKLFKKLFQPPAREVYYISSTHTNNIREV